MPIALYRVDERLIHGQVTVGWGMRLHPDRYLIVDDTLAAADWEQELYRLGAPPEAEVLFLTTAEARSGLAAFQEAPDVTVLLTRDLKHMAGLAEAGALAGTEVNLGGLHHLPGRRAVLPYLFLGADDLDWIRALLGAGVGVAAQDLPGAPKTPAARLLDE